MFVLQLNHMTGSAENSTVVACAETKEALTAFMEREKVQPYTDDGRWHKVFRKGGPLEWFNPPDSIFYFQPIMDIGTENDWAERARAEYREAVTRIPIKL